MVDGVYVAEAMVYVGSDALRKFMSDLHRKILKKIVFRAKAPKFPCILIPSAKADGKGK